MSISAKATFRPRNDLGRFVDAVVSPAVRASVQAGCQLIQQSAQGYAPVDTGALRDSITVELDESGQTIIGRVGPHVHYAEYVEYGTGRAGDPAVPHGDTPGQAPQPYMRPAIDESRGPIGDLFRSNLAVVAEVK